MKKEPVITVASISAGAAAVIALLVSFGVPLTDDQTQAILGVVAVLAPLAVILVRRYVVPNGSVVEHEKGGIVYSGEANEIATGETIRTLGKGADGGE